MSTPLENRNLLVLRNRGYSIHSVMLLAGPGRQVSRDSVALPIGAPTLVNRYMLGRCRIEKALMLKNITSMEMRKYELFNENEPNEMLLSCHEACRFSL